MDRADAVAGKLASAMALLWKHCRKSGVTKHLPTPTTLDTLTILFTGFDKMVGERLSAIACAPRQVDRLDMEDNGPSQALRNLRPVVILAVREGEGDSVPPAYYVAVTENGEVHAEKA